MSPIPLLTELQCLCTFELSQLPYSTEPCLAGKQHRHVNKVATSHAKGLLDLIHTDLHGPVPVQTPDGFKYWLTFIDDHSRHWSISLLKNKSDAFTVRNRNIWSGNVVGKCWKYRIQTLLSLGILSY